ncbi:TLR adapter interacting with SLC15A4 on the lysosome [Ornithorhynchus anatinus]|uniref:TLR adapter interacting with SLC15A4 on the lysosome n=1 Tax=Ornithorhynchus anatinus TaxID=9258 RepID=UPI0010A75CB0|nr:TLR adapter interacting with SLC15A4 on the lysosome [Ornithorhynchus anatinus]
MLAEGCLNGLPYRGKKESHPPNPHQCPGKPKPGNDTWQSQLRGPEDGAVPPAGPRSRERVVPGVPRLGRGERPRGTVGERTIPGAPVPALGGAPGAGGGEGQLDLYRSWSGASICRAYPDLQIGGDRVASIYDGVDGGPPGSTSPGPVLLSADIPPGQPAGEEPPGAPSAPGPPRGDEAPERSLLPGGLPLTNSLLNSYMEKKVEELYKQFFDENLTRCGSVSHLVASGALTSHLPQAGGQRGPESGPELGPARPGVPQPLAPLRLGSAAGAGGSVELSTPNLQISTQSSKEAAPAGAPALV